MTSCGDGSTAEQTVIDYSEIDSIARVDAHRFLKKFDKPLTAMQIEDEILNIKSRETKILERSGKNFALRYSQTFQQTVEETNDSIAKIVFY